MTHNTQGLDEILKEHGGRLATYAELYRKQHHNPNRHQADIDHAHDVAKQAILQWVNDEVIGSTKIHRGDADFLIIKQRNVLKQHGWKESK